jgi:hypothetical protein
VQGTRVLDRVVAERGRPSVMTLDNGSERGRDECLNVHWWANLDEAQPALNDWRRDYNETRHLARGGLPRSFMAGDRAPEAYHIRRQGLGLGPQRAGRQVVMARMLRRAIKGGQRQQPAGENRDQAANVGEGPHGIVALARFQETMLLTAEGLAGSATCSRR